MKRILLVASALLFAVPALAQHAHEKGPNGGPMEDVAGVEVEMVARGRAITFNVFDEARKPVSTTGFSGTVLLTAGSDREMFPLVVDGHALKGEAKSDIAPGSAVTVTLKTAGGTSGQAKFKN